MITQALKDKGITCRGKGFNCSGCKSKDICVDFEETKNKMLVEFKVDDEVEYRDVLRNGILTGIIHCIVEIVDHKSKELIGKKVAYVSKGPAYCSDLVLIEDLKHINRK